MTNSEAQADRLFQQAVSLHRQGQLSQAESLYKQVLTQLPGHADALCNLGLIAFLAGKLDLAIELMQKAIAIEPQRALFYINLGKAWHRLSNYEQAEEAYRRALELDPDNIDAYRILTRLYAYQGHLDKALQLMEQAVRGRHDGDLFSLQANYFYAAGHFEEARQGYQRALECQPDNAIVMRKLVALKKYQTVDEDIEAMIALLESPQTSVNDRIQLSFGLGKVFEDLQQYDKSFEYFRQGNQLKRQSINFDAKHYEMFVEKSIEVFDEEFFKQRQGFGSHDDTPIFILGMPRSGTTLVEQVLSCHSQVYAAGELEELKNALFFSSAALDRQQFPDVVKTLTDSDIRHLAESYLDVVCRFSDKPHVTDKMPANFLYVGMIALMFPNAKVIHCVRDPVATCWSCFQQLFTTGVSFSFDLIDIGKYYLSYQKLMRHWHQVLPGRIYAVEYGRLVQDQQAETKKLLDYCGLKMDEACLDFSRSERSVFTASAQQVRKGLYKDSMQRWLPYKKQLQPLIDVLGVQES